MQIIKNLAVIIHNEYKWTKIVAIALFLTFILDLMLMCRTIIPPISSHIIIFFFFTIIFLSFFCIGILRKRINSNELISIPYCHIVYYLLIPSTYILYLYAIGKKKKQEKIKHCFSCSMPFTCEHSKKHRYYLVNIYKQAAFHHHAHTCNCLWIVTFLWKIF